MRQLVAIAPILLLALPVLVQCQQNGVKLGLVSCYNVSAIPGIIIADNRPPVTLNIFLEFLRRFEDANPTVTVRDLSVLLVQRCRKKHTETIKDDFCGFYEEDEGFAIPVLCHCDENLIRLRFLELGKENPSFKLHEEVTVKAVLKQNGIKATTTERPIDLSIGIPFSPRSFEAFKGTVITERYLTNSTLNLNYGDLDMSDVCAFHYMISNTLNKTTRGDESQTCVRSARYQTRMRRHASEYSGDFDTERVEQMSQQKSTRQDVLTSTGEDSQCPTELGVVYTNYGTIKAGQVLQGLAAGFNMENVDGSDNRYAATLTGDLAHAALIQIQPPLTLGVQGGWNSTINPKYFFLQKNKDLDLTDQDIRGSMDGLFMALKLDSIRRQSDIKLSQIIDMYYSPYQKGVFDSTFRACNRNILYSELVNSDILLQQINSLISPLDNIGNYPGTVAPSSYATLADAAMNNFSSYLPKINDLACPQQDSGIERVSTDLLIFLDPNWNYNTVQPVLSYILDNIDVNKFGSRYTVFRGSDGVDITNRSTRYLLDFHKQYNLSIHENLPKEFDYGKVYERMESIIKSKLNNNSYTGAESTILLLVPRTTPNDYQRTFLDQRKQIIRQFLPDLSVVVLGSGTSGDYSSMLFNPSKDFVSLAESTNDNDLRNVAQNVIDKIKTIPRSIVNPSCGAEFSGSQNTFTVTDYVDLNGINYYKISSNYFYSEGNRNLRVTEVSTGSITVCLSREESRPTNQTGDCQTLQSSVKSFDITGWCGSGSVQECAPIYFSVYGNTTQYRCKDALCRFPNNIKYTITLDNAGCTGSAIVAVSNFILVAVLFLFLRF